MKQKVPVQNGSDGMAHRRCVLLRRRPPMAALMRRNKRRTPRLRWPCFFLGHCRNHPHHDCTKCRCRSPGRFQRLRLKKGLTAGDACARVAAGSCRRDAGARPVLDGSQRQQQVKRIVTKLTGQQARQPEVEAAALQTAAGVRVHEELGRADGEVSRQSTRCVLVGP